MSDQYKPAMRIEIPDNATSITQLPVGMLEAFIPGYSVLSKFLLEVLGFDITFLVSALFLAFGFGTALKFVAKHAYDNMRHYMMSYIRIDSHDDIYDHIMEWVASHKVAKDSRNLLAKTGYENHWELDEDEDQDVEGYQVGGLLNFSNWDSKRPPKFEPSYGTHYFLHKNHLFLFSRDQGQIMDNNWGYTMMRDHEYVKLSCLGRSTQPIKDLIREARDTYLNKKKACTTVRRPAPKQNRNSRSGNWIRASIRPSRPMQTVVLDHELKDRVLQDINEFLRPGMSRWYSDRGVPYRRGYLMHGPPGTGKSSMAWAIAGVFGLDIYCISLVDPNLTEEELGMLFTTLPRRCIVLLEDIDSAGLSKRQEADVNAKANDNSEASKIGAEITKAFESVQKKADKEKQGISLSGLLNAIDGVASHEGRVLIMTSNFPEKLDEALTRPGRIDMHVCFTFATQSQTRELFTRMYQPDLRRPSPEDKKPSVAGKEGSQVAALLNQGQTKTSLNPTSPLTPPLTPRQPTPTHKELDLDEIAAEFADIIPADTFTPAEIQGFLLTRKKEPQKALAEAAEWRDQTLAAKKAKEAKGLISSKVV